jgi:bisphosphoglycerate-dependent phosphoglycerate mutase
MRATQKTPRNGPEHLARQHRWQPKRKRVNKAELAAQLGEEQVKIWRRSYATAPWGTRGDRPAVQRVARQVQANALK